MIAQETVRIEPASYIYRVCHRIMEGDCQMDHGPKMVTVGPLEADVYGAVLLAHGKRRGTKRLSLEGPSAWRCDGQDRNGRLPLRQGGAVNG